MNLIYRIVWNQVLNAWVAVAESARGRGKGSSRKLVAAAVSLTASFAQAAPAGGQVTSGAGNIAQSGNTTTITQSSQNLSLNWQSFNIAKQETVNFVQPSASAIAVNRIFDTNGSQILGQLNANGQVYLINPNGILFGQGAQVNVGSLVASTLDLNDASLSGNSRLFSGAGTGSIINQGTINSANGGYVALLGNTVSNQGTITAPLGTVALGAGNVVTLNFNGNSLVKMQIDQSVLNSLAENGGLIRADGGLVVMSAGAKDALLASVVNNTGKIEARTVQNHEGTIILLGGMAAGTVNVGGMLNASAPNEGNGGFIETSAAHVNVAEGAVVTTRAANGQIGKWLIDPNDFTIAASGGNMTAATVASNLSNTNFEIATATLGTTGGNGDIFVNQALSWTSTNTLTLTAERNIAINSAITATNGGLTLNAVGAISAPAAVNVGTFTLANGTWSQIGVLPAFSATDFRISGGTFIRALGGDGSTNSAYQIADVFGLQGVGSIGMLGKSYVLANNIDASSTATWNSNAGFSPIVGSRTVLDTSFGCQRTPRSCRPPRQVAIPFTGSFDGLGHTISNLTINRPTASNVGLFGNLDTNAVISNVGLVGGSIMGNNNVGALVGTNFGTITNSFATTDVNTGINSGIRIGGLVGSNSAFISNSYATGSVSGNTFVGGLAGSNEMYGTIRNSYATGGMRGITGSNGIGGLVGLNDQPGSSIVSSYSTSNVSGTTKVGGLIGNNNNAVVTNSYSTGLVTGDTSAGGFIGYLYAGTLSNNFWDAMTSGKPDGLGIGTSLVYVNGWRDVDGVAGTPQTGVKSFSTLNMISQASFTSATAANGNINPNWDFANTWYMVDGRTRPFLRMEYSTSISNTHQLQLMGMNLAANYTLANNLDLAAELTNPSGMWGTASNSVVTGTSAGFASIGNASTAFSGTFDGLGHTISNLTQRNALNDSGLFGQIGAAGTVKNLGLTDVTIIKQGYGNNNYLIPFGALTGTNAGRVSNVYSTGTITNSGPNYNAVGGLVGVNTGLISNAYSSATLSSGMWGTSVGGLVGINSGTISGSYAAGAVTGSGKYVNVGGLVGKNTAGSIHNSYAIGAVTSGGTPDSNTIGGLVGLMSGGTIVNAYATGLITATKYGSNYGSGLIGSKAGGSISNSLWDTTTSNRATGIGYPWDSQSGVTGLTILQMMQMASFSGWNTATPNSIANTGGSGAIWRIYEGHTAPLLTSFMTSVVLADTSVTYNGTAQTGATTALNSTSVTRATGTNVGVYGNAYSTQQGYDISGGNLTINAAALSAISLSGTRAYDGTVNVAASIFTLSGLVNGENLNLTGVGTVADKNVGSNKTVSLGSLALGNGTGSGTNGLASNYIFAGGTQTASITPATLVVSGLTAADKVYDANTTATLGGTAVIAALGSDVVTLGGTASGVFADKNVGTAKGVTVSGNTIMGTDAGNYSLLQPTGLTATISKAQLGFTAIPASFLNGQTPNDLSGTVSGFATGDTLTNSTSGRPTWTTPANASSKPGSYAIDGSGLLASNYLFSQAAANATALTLAPATPPTPVFNATTQLTSITALLQAVVPPTVFSISPVIRVTQTNSVETAGSSTGSNSKPDKVAVTNTSMTVGAIGPALQIVNGGMRLPVAMVNVNE